MSAELQQMAVARGSLPEHAPAAGVPAIERVRAAAAPLAGTRVAHVSVAGGGGRVPELLSSLLPLAVDAGLEVEWHVLFGGPELHAVAHALHDGLQGAETAIEEAAFGDYLDACAAAAEPLSDRCDVMVLHDPGTLGLAAAAEPPVVWACHVDASLPDPPALERTLPLAGRCAAVTVPLSSFAPAGVDAVHEVPPGIDPLSPRNLELAPRLAGRVVRPLGVDLNRPFCCQVMRFDRWKDPHAAIESFGFAKEELGELQLVLAGALERDDADGWRVVKEITDYAEGRADLHVLTSYEGVGNLELGALQRLARVSLQRALREGFGLAASESLWKGTPVVGGTGGGLPAQVRDGIEGYLTDDIEAAAARIVELVRDPGLAIDMGRAGQERVRERFLVTRALEDELRVLGDTLRSG